MQGSSTSAEAELNKLREELAATFAKAAELSDRIAEISRRIGAEAALADIVNDASRKLGGMSAGFAGKTTLSGRLEQAAPSVPLPAPTRAPSGAVQGAILDVLDRSLVALTPLKIVAAAKEMGFTLKESSVRMALSVLRDRGRVVQDGHGNYRIASRDDAADANASGATPSET